MPKKILIVDDEENIVISLDFLMSSSGYEVFIARNGKEAYKALLNSKPDLILLDIMLPDCMGFEICQSIRENPELKNIKIIFLTARGMEKDMEKGMALGADAYIIKPFSTKELVQKVSNILED